MGDTMATPCSFKPDSDGHCCAKRFEDEARDLRKALCGKACSGPAPTKEMDLAHGFHRAGLDGVIECVKLLLEVWIGD
jgi:hypothetical protein